MRCNGLLGAGTRSCRDTTVVLQEGPGEAAVAALAQASETPERLWNRNMAATTAEEVAHLAASARLAQACPVFQTAPGNRKTFHYMVWFIPVGLVF